MDGTARPHNSNALLSAALPPSPHCPRPSRSVTASVDETAGAVKARLWAGGLGRGGAMSTGARSVVAKPEDLVLIYAGQQMDDAVALKEYHVPPGCKVMIAIDAALLASGKPDANSAYWC